MISRLFQTMLLLLAPGLVVGCASKRTHAAVSCTTIASSSCGMACASTVDCGAGLFCGPAKTCIAECVQGKSGCGSNETCSGNGQCVATSGGKVDAGVPCPSGLMCNVSCPSSGTTTVTGKVYDPAMKNGLYNISVYVPESALTPLPKGVLTGANACSCAALYQSGAVVSTSTIEDGTFVLNNVPVGTSVPLVIQVGKWRRLYHIPVTACQANAQADKTLALPSTVAAGDTDDNIPDIAVSTGEADSLECLMRRIGLPTTEYVAGTGTTGHVHVFSGGETPCGGLLGCPDGAGVTETTPMTGAPSSPTALWSTSNQLMPYDVVLLSCEGGETYMANPPALETYLNAGGRVFASHFHYAWFSGPKSSTQSYMAPSDWGMNLATWSEDSSDPDGDISGTIQTTLNGSTAAFPKGVSLQKWLGNVNALGQNKVPAGDLSIYQPRFNAVVGTTNTDSQAWISSVPTTGKHNNTPASTMYFSFNTPTNPTTMTDAGTPNYCGRAVFSDLHVSGDPSDQGDAQPPDGCVAGDLSPQEKALEFMLFDLSSCVIPDTVAPPTGVPIQ